MRKYQYKESRNLARILGMVNATQVRLECGARVFKKPLLLLEYRASFYWIMLKFRWMLGKARRIDFHSEDDFHKLKDMWRSILKRKYESKY